MRPLVTHYDFAENSAHHDGDGVAETFVEILGCV